MHSASSIIDGYLSVRYAVPINPTTQLLRDLCVDIALYRMALSRLKQTAEMRLRYEDAIKLLTRISDGKASIGQDTDDDGLSDDQSGSAVAKYTFVQRA
jgi:phage gp36-like protein